MGHTQKRMEELLTAHFKPAHLTVTNDSARHAGHAGDDGSGETHFTVEVESAAFTGLSRVARQRAVNGALKEVIGNPVHALVIRATAPGE